MTYPRTIDDLEKIYDSEGAQAGDIDKDFYKWAIAYLLDKLNTLLDTEMNVYGETLEVILNAREEK